MEFFFITCERYILVCSTRAYHQGNKTAHSLADSFKVIPHFQFWLNACACTHIHPMSIVSLSGTTAYTDEIFYTELLHLHIA